MAEGSGPFPHPWFRVLQRGSRGRGPLPAFVVPSSSAGVKGARAPSRIRGSGFFSGGQGGAAPFPHSWSRVLQRGSRGRGPLPASVVPGSSAGVKGARVPSRIRGSGFFSGGQGGAGPVPHPWFRVLQRGSRGRGPRPASVVPGSSAGVKGARPPWSQLFFAYFLFTWKRK